MVKQLFKREISLQSATRLLIPTVILKKRQDVIATPAKAGGSNLGYLYAVGSPHPTAYIIPLITPTVILLAVRQACWVYFTHIHSNNNSKNIP